MRLAILLALLASSVLAQNRSASTPAPAACGPTQVQFQMKLDRSPQNLAHPEPGKALVYVFEEFQESQRGFTTPTIRVGLNGAWMGATRGFSFLFFSVRPGEHHLCVNWQSSSSHISSQYSLANFSAESAKVYFSKVVPRVESYHDSGNAGRKHLAPTDQEEANYLLGISSSLHH